MLFAGGSRRAAVLAATLLVALLPAHAAEDAAHKLAEKFAGEGEKTEAPASPSPEQNAEIRRKAEEARKRDAERQAQEKLKEEARQRAEAALKAERARQRPVAKKAEPPPQAPKAPSATEENDILARARAEEEQRKAAENRDRTDDEARRVIEEAERASRQLEELLAKTEPPAQKPTPTPSAQPASPVAPTPVAEPSAPPPAAKPAVVATEPPPPTAEQEQAKAREAEATRFAAIAQAKRVWHQSVERLEAHARAAAAQAEAEKERARLAAATPPPPPSASAPPTVTPVATPAPPALPPPPAASPPTVLAEAPAPAPSVKPAEPPKPEVAAPVPPPPPSRALEAHVTVLLVMQPGNYGIRRNNKTADPLLCTPEGCFIGTGSITPANFLKGSKATGVGNTFGGRAGACRNQLGCVFRAIPVREAPLMLQPVDLHVIKHDRRRPQAIVADSQCGLFGGKLSCSRGIYADDYTLWIVPESVADAVGPDALQRAVAEGLNGPRSAALDRR